VKVGPVISRRARLGLVFVDYVQPLARQAEADRLDVADGKGSSRRG
jgi:hypothetical protein